MERKGILRFRERGEGNDKVIIKKIHMKYIVNNFKKQRP